MEQTVHRETRDRVWGFGFPGEAGVVVERFERCAGFEESIPQRLKPDLWRVYETQG